MDCPNGHGTLEAHDDGKKVCSKCGYSLVPPKSSDKGSQHITAVNKAIKGLLVEARLSGEPVPWKRQWIIIPKRNYFSNRLYNGINRWLLSLDDDVAYTTEDSAIKHGGARREDAQPRLVVSWVPPRLTKEQEKLPKEEQEKILKKKHPFMTTFIVYRAKDFDLPEKTYDGEKEHKRFNDIEEFVKSTGITIKEGGNAALYSWSEDAITVPKLSCFETPEEYYRTLLHELVHATGHETRLNREHKKYQRDDTYGREELIAEMGSAYLCHYFGIEPTENTVAYIDGWLHQIEADPKLLVTAGQQAEKVLAFFKLTE